MQSEATEKSTIDSTILRDHLENSTAVRETSDRMAPNTLIPDSERQQLASLVDHAPWPLAHAIDSCLDNQRASDLFFFCETVFRYAAMVTKSAYLESAGRGSVRINDAVRRWLIQPSMGSWKMFLKVALDGLVQGEFESPVADLQRILELLTSEAVAALVTLRNEAHGHPGVALPAEVEQWVVGQAVANWSGVLAATELLSKYPLLVFDDQRQSWQQWMGRDAVPVTHAPEQAISSAGVLSCHDGQYLPLFPLVMGTFPEFVPSLKVPPQASEDLRGAGTLLVFDGVQSEKQAIVYVGRYGRGHGRRWFDEYRALLDRKQIPVLPIAANESSARELLRRSTESLETTLAADREEGRWHDVESLLNEQVQGLLDDAVEGEEPLAVLTGDAGVGKTTHLALAALRWSRGGIPVIFLHASRHFARPFRDSLHTALEGALSVVGSRESILSGLQSSSIQRSSARGGQQSVPPTVDGPAAAAQPARVVIVIDGLDEIGTPRLAAEQLKQAASWLLKARRAGLVGIRVIVGIRASYVEELERRNVFADLRSLLYRPTSRSISGQDEVGSVIWLPAAPRSAEPEVRRRFEYFREHIPGYRPLTCFDELDDATKAACRNPRQMTQILVAFHGQEVRSLGGALDVWDAILEKHILALPSQGGRRPPLFPRRVKLLRTMVEGWLNSSCLERSLDGLEENAATAALVVSGDEPSALDELVSLGLLEVYVSGETRDPFGPRYVRPASEGIAAAAFLRSPPLRDDEPEAWLEARARLGEGTAAAVYDAALVLAFERATRVDPDAVLGAIDLVDEPLQLEVFSAVTRALVARGDARRCWEIWSSRQALLERAIGVASRRGDLYILEPFATALLELEAAEVGPSVVAFVTRILRAVERIEELETWLRKTTAVRRDMAGTCFFHLAEVLRDKGQWQRASRSYESALESDAPPGLHAMAHAGHGECAIWLGKATTALASLAKAGALVGEEGSPEVRCNIHLKRGVAARLMGKIALAATELSRAEELALQHGFRTEVAKAWLELGLCAVPLGMFEEAKSLVVQALERHRGQRFVKGEKKALHCLGYVLEKEGKDEDARKAYEESLALNTRYFDLLGLDLNHTALARLLRKTDPEAASTHAASAKSFGERRKGVDLTDEDAVVHGLQERS